MKVEKKTVENNSKQYNIVLQDILDFLSFNGIYKMCLWYYRARDSSSQLKHW